MSNKQDLTGQKFGKLLVIKSTPKRDSSGCVFWECLCDCGNVLEVPSRRLKTKNTQSCGCLRKDNAILRRQNLENKKFGRLLVIEFSHIDKWRDSHWKCVCECGNSCISSGKNLKNGNTKSCGCIARSNIYKAIKISAFIKNKKYKKLSYSYFNKIKNRAKKKKIDFSITIEYIYNLFLKQNKKCYLSQTELILADKDGSNFTASLDRIDSSKGYIEGNIAWCHKRINKLKNNFSNEEFIDWCHLISKNNQKKINEINPPP